MKKFSERSRRGQQRILICAASAVTVLLIGGVLLFDKSSFEDFNDIFNSFIEATATPVPTGIQMEPTVPPVVTGPAEITPVPTENPGQSGEEPGIQTATAQDIVDRVLRYTLEKSYAYGMTSEQGMQIREDTLVDIAGIKKGEEINIDDVGPGDIGVYGDSVCVCIGIDGNGKAVFAYANAYKSDFLPSGGIYLGYSISQYDSLFYGMYPVPCETYFDCADGTADMSLAVKKAERYYETTDAYTEALFGVGRMFSEKMAEEIKSLVPADKMLEQNVKFEDGGMEKFLDNFAVCAGAEELAGKDFCFKEKKVFRLSTGIYLEASLLNLSPDGFLSSMGSWDMTVSDECLIPYPVYCLSDYIGRGFAKAQETVYHYDEHGNLTGYEVVDVVDKSGTVVENEDGNRTYIGEGFSAELEENDMFLPQDETIIDAGDGFYVLKDNNGEYHSIDMRRYGELPEQVIRFLLEEELKRLNGEVD